MDTLPSAFRFSVNKELAPLWTAFLSVRRELKPIHNDQTATVPNKYSWRYASLSTIFQEVHRACSAHGIIYKQNIAITYPDRGPEIYIERSLIHAESGAEIIFTPSFFRPTAADATALGAAMSYIRRYTVMNDLDLDDQEDGDQRLAEAKMAEEERLSPTNRQTGYQQNQTGQQGQRQTGQQQQQQRQTTQTQQRQPANGAAKVAVVTTPANTTINDAAAPDPHLIAGYAQRTPDTVVGHKAEKVTVNHPDTGAEMMLIRLQDGREINVTEALALGSSHYKQNWTTNLTAWFEKWQRDQQADFNRAPVAVLEDCTLIDQFDFYTVVATGMANVIAKAAAKKLQTAPAAA